MAEPANGVTEPAEANTAPVESPSTETNDSTESSDDDQFVLGLGEPDEASEDKTEEAPSEPEETKEQPTRAEMRKQQLTNEIRDKVAERNALRNEVAELLRQKESLNANQNPNQGPLTVDGLVDQINPVTGDYYTRAEAENVILSQRLDALEKQRAFDQYVEHVTDNIAQMSNEANQVIKDFPIFNPESDQYNAELATAADKLMMDALIVDNGQVIGSRISPYQLYSTIANAKASGEVSGKTSGRKAALNMMRNADVDGSAKAPSTGEEDDFVKGLLDL